MECHPSPGGAFNVFLATAVLALGESSGPARSKRIDWPERNGFSHFSSGHEGVTCGECHESEKMKGVNSIASVPIPDETSKGCRECHLKTRFHWR